MYCFTELWGELWRELWGELWRELWRELWEISISSSTKVLFSLPVNWFLKSFVKCVLWGHSYHWAPQESKYRLRHKCKMSIFRYTCAQSWLFWWVARRVGRWVVTSAVRWHSLRQRYKMSLFRYHCAVLLRREVRREVRCEVPLLELWGALHYDINAKCQLFHWRKCCFGELWSEFWSQFWGAITRDVIAKCKYFVILISFYWVVRWVAMWNVRWY